jgi:hypothetical protein
VDRRGMERVRGNMSGKLEEDEIGQDRTGKNKKILIKLSSIHQSIERIQFSKLELKKELAKGDNVEYEV